MRDVRRVAFELCLLLLISGCGQSEMMAPAPAETKDADASEAAATVENKKYPPGQYLVGTDIPAGVYKLLCEEPETRGYYCVSSGALARAEEIIGNDNFYNMSYVSVEDGQYLELSRCYTEDALRLEEVPTPAENTVLETPQPEAVTESEITDGVPAEAEQISDDSIFDEETAERLDDAIADQKKRQFMLCIAQDDLEGYYWGADSACPGLWQELFVDNGFNGQDVLQEVKNDLDIYLAFGSSSYEALWIGAEAIYESYDSGQLEESLGEDGYQDFRDKMNAVSSRLGILYESPEYIIQ